MHQNGLEQKLQNNALNNQAMPTQIHNQSTKPTESGDDPRVPNYPRRSIAPSAQNNALYDTITRDLLKSPSSNH